MSSTPRMPSESECLAILVDEGCKRNVIEHVCTVHSIAMEMARLSSADLELVSAGALLHDLGRCRQHDIRHVSEGARIARDRALPESLVRVIERHVAAGLTEEEAKEFGLPPGVYMPETLEEKIVCHADNLVKGPGKTPNPGHCRRGPGPAWISNDGGEDEENACRALSGLW